jgi:hypothetical protein
VLSLAAVTILMVLAMLVIERRVRGVEVVA